MIRLEYIFAAINRILWIYVSLYIYNLNIGAVDELGEIGQSDDVVVDVAPHLHEAVGAVRGVESAVGADGGAAVEAAYVLLVLPRCRVDGAAAEEFLRVQRLQPRRLPMNLLKKHNYGCLSEDRRVIEQVRD